eukprot:281157_1
MTLFGYILLFNAAFCHGMWWNSNQKQATLPTIDETSQELLHQEATNNFQKQLLQCKQELEQHEDTTQAVSQLDAALTHCKDKSERQKQNAAQQAAQLNQTLIRYKQEWSEEQNTNFRLMQQQKSYQRKLLQTQETIADLKQKTQRIVYLEKKTFYEDIFILLIIGILIIYVIMYFNNQPKKIHNEQNMSINRYKHHQNKNMNSYNENQRNMNKNGYSDRNIKAIEMQLSFKELDGIPKRNFQQTLQLLSKDIAVEIIQNYNAGINNKNFSIFQSNKPIDKVKQIIYNYLITASTQQYQYNQQMQMILPFESVKIHAVMTVFIQHNGNTVNLKAKVMSKTLEFA